MLSLNRICCYLIIFGVIILIPSVNFITYSDELISVSFLAIALADCIINRCWKKYSLLWIIMSILSIYAIYSLYLPYNTLRYILLDWIIELKPLIPFCVLFAIGPSFTNPEKKLIRIICWINISIIAVCFALGMSVIKTVMFHPAYPSMYALISGLLFYYCSLSNDNVISDKNLWISIAMMAVGIFGFKAKFFGTFILSLYLLLFYKPGICRNLNYKHILILIILCLLVLGATWNKINYYFIQGDTDSFDLSTIESFARPVLYMTGGLILLDHFPFGTGLASFATFASGENYSLVYYEYGINNVHGLSPNQPYFICDAFFPSLAQYGFVGLLLFIYFWVYIYSYLRIMIRTNPNLYRPLFTTGSISIIFILVESTTGTTFTQTGGLIVMSLLGIVCAKGRLLKQSERLSNTNTLCINKQKI
ncbi:MAG: hypothetical protein HDS21_02995 [Bacteroides sp.]|nr:hypothetical protein [Bacteroides sp.]